jgi:hypothetical protein
MRQAPLSVAGLLAAFAIALTLGAGCGSSDDATTTSAEEKINPATYLLSAREVRRLARPFVRPGAVMGVLEFWRAVQYQNYAAAYLRLSAALRRSITYERFLQRVASARGQLFLVKPIIEDVKQMGTLTTVYLRLQRGKEFSPTDQVIGFNMAREEERWLIATDPYNLFRIPPPS